VVGIDGSGKTAAGGNKDARGAAPDIFPEIDFSRLMDLRVDYAFKLLFGGGDTRYLISLLNAVFSDKDIGREIKSLAIANPGLERKDEGDKMSVLDIRARLADGTSILIEMHLYDMGEFKYKTLRSWARAYGEELGPGEGYSLQPPVVCVSFVDGAINGAAAPKVHSLYQILERDDGDLLSGAMEMHYINMKAFAEAVNRGKGFPADGPKGTMFAKWLAIITQNKIEDKTIIEDICKSEGEIMMAVETLDRLSKDKYERQAYQRRMDEIAVYNITMQRAEEDRKRAETYRRRAESDRKRAESDRKRAESDRKRAEADRKRAEAAEAAIVEKDRQIAELRARLDGK
jgi:predicted transposase/invertase (TIGR01784 family)